MQKDFKTIIIPKLPVLSTEQGINLIKKNLDSLKDWKNLFNLIPKYFSENKHMKKTGLAGIFAASLELSKQGVISISQKKIFDKVLIKKIN